MKSIITRAKSRYYKSAFEASRGNMSSTWNLIRVLTSNGANNRLINKIVWNNDIYLDDLSIANAFNQYFTSIPVALDENLQPSSIDPLSFLPPINNSSFFLRPIENIECSNIIMSLKRSKQDKNTIPVEIFIKNHLYYLPTICDMINKSFSSGVFPSLLKIAVTIPIFKKGDASSISNYRPISILPFLSKIFEKSISSRIKSFLSSFNIVSQSVWLSWR